MIKITDELYPVRLRRETTRLFLLEKIHYNKWHFNCRMALRIRTIYTTIPSTFVKKVGRVKSIEV